MTAMDCSRSIANTMGFTAVEGLVMGTRSGSLRSGRAAVDDRASAYGMSTTSVRCSIQPLRPAGCVRHFKRYARTLLASDAPAAAEAVDLFCYRISRELGSLGGRARRARCNRVHPSGIGEHDGTSARVACVAWRRGSACRSTRDANARHGPRIERYARLSIEVWVNRRNEELMTLPAIR